MIVIDYQHNHHRGRLDVLSLGFTLSLIACTSRLCLTELETVAAPWTPQLTAIITITITSNHSQTILPLSLFAAELERRRFGRSNFIRFFCFVPRSNCQNRASSSVRTFGRNSGNADTNSNRSRNFSLLFSAFFLWLQSTPIRREEIASHLWITRSSAAIRPLHLDTDQFQSTGLIVLRLLFSSLFDL
jgi:hypothetical protein